MFFQWLFYVLLVKTVFATYGNQYMFANQSVGSPNVSTTSGQFMGLTIQQTNVWIGIPFAAPPIGRLRWQKAHPYVPSSSQNSTIQDATRYGATCPQINLLQINTGPFDEDCLYLNVWAPKTPSSSAAGYPVLIWIHGGGFVAGSSSEGYYDGLIWTNAAINNSQPFVMVSFNYRLNAMGFFSQPTLLDGNGRTIANQGLSDQRMAMKWVQDNIAKFGGNKNSVTIMGESAGAFSVCFHLVSPLSAGLFQAAILDSGPCDTGSYLRDIPFAYSMTNTLASRVGCGNMNNSSEQLACLQSVNSTLLATATGDITAPASTITAFRNLDLVGGFFPFFPIVDEIELPIHPLEAFLTGKINQVPVLVGANHDEYLIRLMYEVWNVPPTSQQYYLTVTLPIKTYNNSALQAFYNLSLFNGNYTAAAVALFSESMFICGARRLAGYMNVKPTYLYSFNHALESPYLQSLALWPGAFHVAELFSIFQVYSDTFYGKAMFSDDEYPLAKTIQGYWTNMITSNQPNNNNISFKWPQYSSATDQAIVLKKNLTSSTWLNIYPSCDLWSALQVQVFAQYLGFNATCVAGNKCFIVNSTTSTTVMTTTASGNNLRYSLFTLLSLCFSCNLFVSWKRL